MKRPQSFQISLILSGAVIPLLGRLALAVDDVNGGSLFTMNNSATSPNGAWCWFQDQRAMIDRSVPSAPRLFLSSVSSSATAAENGDVDLVWRDLSTGTQGEYEFYNQLEADDHNEAAFYMRPDGRYIAMYSKHTSDAYTHYRVSTNPHDPTSWGSDTLITNSANATYDNIYYLPNDRGGQGRLYNFTRSVGWDPNIQTSTDQGNNWSLAGRLLAEGGDSDRPYAQYAGNGKDKVHFVTTDRHPDNYANNLYYGYVSDGVLYNTNNSVVDSNLFDATAVAPSALTKIFTNGSVWNGTVMNRAWSTDIQLDKTKNPVVIFQACANDSRTDHRFFYARFDGAEWKVNEMAKAGGYLYSSQQNYTGLGTVDPDNPNIVYISTKIDPRNSNVTTNKYEIYKGVTSDFGATWTWVAITAGSTMDNLRPSVPQWDGANTALLWMRGTYNSYTSWDTKIVGINFAKTDARSSVWRGDAAIANRWDINTTTNWDSGGGISNVYGNGDEVTFDDSAASFNVNIQSTVSPIGIAFNNTSNNYTITGSGIGGSGGLRVLGGGTATLNNAANTYTGETRIFNGKLALSGNSSLSNTSKITIDPQGTLDVTGMTSNAYSLSNKTVNIDGKIVGNINAVSNSTITANSANSIQGNLTLNASTISGNGGVTGHLIAFNGGMIRVGTAGLGTTQVTSSVNYTDATATNTRAYDNTTYPGNTWKIDVPSGTGTVDNLWDNRQSLANSSNIISSNNTNAENAPLIQTTVSGLTPGQSYQVFGYFWNASGVNWQLRATDNASDIQTNGTATLADDNLAAATNVNFSASGTAGSTNAPAVATGFEGTDNLGVATTGSGTLYSGAAEGYFASNVMVAESNRYLLQASLGSFIANAGGQIVVYVDDNASGAANARTWYDGIGVQTVNTTVTPGVIDFSVGGNLTMNAGSILDLDVYNATAHDRVVVGGTATFGGTVILNPASVATPVGEQVELLTYASRTGRFQTINDSTNRFSIFYNNVHAVAIADTWNNPSSLAGDLDVPVLFTVTGNTPWSGSHGKYGAGTVEYNGNQTFAAGASMNLNAGTTRFSLDAADNVTVGSGVNVTVNSGATLATIGTKSPLGTAAGNRASIANNGTFNSSTTTNYLASLTGTGTTNILSGTLNLSQGLIQGLLSVSNGATVDIATNSSTSKVNSLNLNSTGTINLHNSDLVVDYGNASSPYQTVVNKVKSGLAVLSGNGQGIASTEVDAQLLPGTMLAVVDNGAVGGAITTLSTYSDFSANSVLVKYTWFGDSNLDGVVDGSDYILLDTGFSSGGTIGGWVFGDYDYNGVVDDSDYILIDTGFVNQSTVLPEPGILGFLGLGMLSLHRRRRSA